MNLNKTINKREHVRHQMLSTNNCSRSDMEDISDFVGVECTGKERRDKTEMRGQPSKGLKEVEKRTEDPIWTR